MLKGHNIFHYLLTVVIYFVRDSVFFVLWILIGLGGYYILLSKISPLNAIVGLPLMLLGLGMSLNSLSSLFYSIFSLKFNREECIICRKEAEE